MDVVFENKVERTEGKIVGLLANHCECALFTMIVHLCNHICADLETFCIVKFLDAATHETLCLL